MRISDWSSDVCSSDLLMDRRARLHRHVRIGLVAAGEVVLRLDVLVLPFATNALVALATIAFTQRRNIDGIGRRRLCRFALHSFPLDIALSAAECRPVVCRVCLSGFAFFANADGRRERVDRKSTRLNSSHYCAPRMPSSACKKKIT